LPEDHYTVIFDQATGVAPGTPVRRSGVRIGQVQSVYLDDATGKVRVEIRIDHRHVLYQDDQPTLMHGALTGDTSIDLLPTPHKPKQETSVAGPGAPIVQVSLPLAQVQPQPAAPPAQPPATPRPLAQPGTEFKGISQGDVAALLDKLVSITPTAQDALVELRRTMERLEKISPLIEETLAVYRDLGKKTNDLDLRRTNEDVQAALRTWNRLGEKLDVLYDANQAKINKTIDGIANTFSEENQRNWSTTLRNVATSSQNFESISKRAEDLLTESQKSVVKLNDTIGLADKVFNNLQDATKPLAERGPTVMKNLDETTERLNRTLADVQDLMRTLNQADGTFRRFLVDPSLYNNLNDAVSTILHAMPRIEQILKDVEVFSDKIARHPESLGIRGAVSPSSGLKESPTRPAYIPHN
jgi:ABC-type transporter Mla subunit MlaD